MREIHQRQLQIGQVSIEKMEIELDCRDDTTAVLRGLQHLFCTPAVYTQVMGLLEKHLLAHVKRGVGRPGLDLWQILVLGLLKEGLNLDFDRLRNLANHHDQVRQMLGHGVFDETRYKHQRLLDNVSLLTPELLAAINKVLVQEGHTVLEHSAGEALRGRCDSFVAETDVHYPTDVSLLWDAMRCLLKCLGRQAGPHGVTGWRQWQKQARKVRSLFHAVRQTRRATRPRVVAYLRTCKDLVSRAKSSLKALEEAGMKKSRIQQIKDLIAHAERQIDQSERRLLEGEKIPQEEKVFSIFEPHTRWISKGKAGCPVELGVPVCVVEDQHQFLLHHKVLWEGGDVDIAEPIIEETQELFPDLRACSFDRNFHSPENRIKLDKLLDLNALPAKGKLSTAQREREAEESFRKARRQHSAVEAAINHLEHHGLDRVRTMGKAGFERTVALAVLGANLHRLGRVLLQADREAAQCSLAA